MRIKTAIVLCLIFFLNGCASNRPVENALLLRDKIANSNGCSFYAKIVADYGNEIYSFSMDCLTDKVGNLTFTVVKPTTLNGITGKVDVAGGAITFDDKILAFQTMADGQVTPVSAPWLLIKALRSGYIKGCTDEKDGFQISVDDSYEEDALHLNIWVQDDVPRSGEIFWQGRRVLTVTVENFLYL